jgi:hypothetical protein
MSSKATINVIGFATSVAAAIRQYGWVSKKTAMEQGITSTVDMAIVALTEEEDEAKAQAAIGWMRTQYTSGDEFTLRMVQAVAGDTCKAYEAPFVANAVNAYDRYLARQAAKQAQIAALPASANTHVAPVGSKIITQVEILIAKEIYGSYGVSTMLKMKDEQGRILVWFATRASAQVGDVLLLAGTVKDCRMYNGVAETVITRGKLEHQAAWN